MLSGQGHPDVFWWLFFFFFLPLIFEFNDLRFLNETLGPFPQSNYHVKQLEKLMVISSWGYLNWTLKHIVQRNTHNKKVNSHNLRNLIFSRNKKRIIIIQMAYTIRYHAMAAHKKPNMKNVANLIRWYFKTAYFPWFPAYF